MFTTQLSPEHLQLSQERTVVALALPAFQFQAATIQAVHVRLNLQCPLTIACYHQRPTTTMPRSTMAVEGCPSARQTNNVSGTS